MGNEEQRGASPDKILDFVGLGRFQFVAFLLAGSTYLSYACDGGLLFFIDRSLQKEWNITVTEYAILPAVTCIPNVVGAVLFSSLSDMFGRVWPYAFCMGWISLFSVVSSFSNRFYIFVVLRCLVSIGIGGVSSLVNPTIVEFLPVRNRGKVLTLNMLVTPIGFCLSCGLAWWLIPSYPVHGWRYYVIASGLPSALVCIFRLAFYFESPRFLITKKKYNKAWKIFNNIALINGKDLSELTSSKPYSIQLSKPEVHSNVNGKPVFVEQLLKMFHPSSLRITLPLTVITVTEAVGYFCSQLFLPNFLENVGVSTYFTMMMTSIAQILGFSLLSIIIEWPEIGRLNSFRIFSFLSMLFFLLLTFIQTSITVPIFLIMIYFSTGPIIGLIYSYVSEFYPTSVRSASTAYFYVFQSAATITGSMAISKAIDIPQHWLFPAVFAVCYLIQLIMAFIMNYEPLGRRLRDKS